jgi:hypothetical protein
MLRRTLEIKFKGMRHMGRLRTSWFDQILKCVKKRRKSWPEIKG